MAKKTSKKEKKAEKPKTDVQNMLANLPTEMKERMEGVKDSLDKFTKQILEKFDKYIVGVSLLPPPRKEQKEEQDIDPTKINVLVLVDDADSQKIPKEELSSKVTAIIEKMGKDLDNNLAPQVMLLSELREVCYDSKYDLLNMIAVSAPVYDPKDLLAGLKISELHKNMVIKKFEKYILSYVAAGSLFRGEQSNDIDVYVVIDDTDVKKMPRTELRDKLRAIIVGMGFEASKITGIQKQFHIQTYILTDFWDQVKDASPVIFTFLRDGVPLYDRGVFMPWKLLLKMGRVKPSMEAIDMNMDIGERLLERIRHKMLSVVGEDLYYAVLNPAQAALMLYGIPPPTPKETIHLLDEIFVKKEKLLEKKYVQILADIRTAYKNIEHGKTKAVSGKDIDKLLKDAQDYLARIKKLFEQISERAAKESILDTYDACIGITRDLLSLKGAEATTDEKVITLFKAKLMPEEKIPDKFLRILNTVKKAKTDYLAGKMSKQELEKARKEANLFIKAMVEHMQRKKLGALERIKVRVKYGNKIGELMLFDDAVFIVKDLEKRDELQKAEITEDGHINNLKPSNLEELEKYMVKLGIPRKIFIKEHFFGDLKDIFGTDVEVMLNY
ncbi:MAG: hypothetical protein V1914_03120 [archaeon]